MKISLSGSWKIFKTTFKEWKADDPFRQSAVIAYYAIFSLPALLVLVINFAGLFFGKIAVSQEISRQIESVMGTDTAKQVGDMVAKAGQSRQGIISSSIAFVTLILGSIGVFEELQKTLNQVWDVKEKKHLKNFLLRFRNKLFSFGLVLSIGFLLLVSLVMSSALAVAGHWLESRFPDGIAYILYAVEFLVSFSVITFLFMLMFKFLPDVRMKWKPVIIGSVLTSFLFTLGKYALSFYFGKTNPVSVYGAAGSIVLILLWVSYSSMIVFFGAEFIKQYALYHGEKIHPTINAEKINANQDPDQAQKKLRDQPLPENDHHADHEDGHKQKIKMKTGKKNHLKSSRDVRAEIALLEKKLKSDKEGIKDNLKLSHLFSFLIPKAFRVEKTEDEQDSFDNYLRKIARTHIKSDNSKNLLDRTKEALHINKDGADK